MFHEIFKAELIAASGNDLLVEKLLNEVKTRYSEAHRHYHTYSHLDDLVKVLLPVKEAIQDWTILVFSIAYHDIIYQVDNSNNEEQSASLARLRLSQLNLAESRIEKCVAMIRATKQHSFSEDSDTNYFTDADLSILGAEPKEYKTYAEWIRREYQIYPHPIYQAGRKKVLQHFLERPRIYKTAYFLERYEKKARKNLEIELSDLQ